MVGLLSYVHSKQAFSCVFAWIEQIFTYYIDEIINSESKLVRCRYALFLGYLIDMLYKDN